MRDQNLLDIQIIINKMIKRLCFLGLELVSTNIGGGRTLYFR